jgi:Flp pilus assembly pilin Flp
MKYLRLSSERGQSNVEYVLVLLLVTLIVIPVVTLFGHQISAAIQQVFDGQSTPTVEPVITAPPTDIPEQKTAINKLADDFTSRIMDFYKKYGKWPGSSGDRRFTDLGLNPDNWDKAVQGIYWNPNGDKIGLANKKNDNLQLYVNDLNGNQLHVYDGWNVWCVASSGNCYINSVDPRNLVDINSLVVVQSDEHN